MLQLRVDRYPRNSPATLQYSSRDLDLLREGRRRGSYQLQRAYNVPCESLVSRGARWPLNERPKYAAIRRRVR